ncbi:MAG: peptidoglycan DD-metalloendopeptidase family protein [Deltaproteobacteria bacterium]|nr:peptidoglycan DD-metalloendopeptidase family protein [Deltaproteobacteria bacterium]
MKGPAVNELGIAHPGMKGEHVKTERDRALMKACREFESILTYQLLKSMRRTVEKCELFHGGQGEEIYESLLDQELARNIAQSESNSLAYLLYQQLKRKDRVDLEAGTPPSPMPLPLRNRYGEIPLTPLETARESSGFGWRKDPFTGERKFHYGVDLAAREGTMVRAALGGKVVASEYREGYGNVVILDHGKGLRTLYAHNKENLVEVGEWISRGCPVARVGSTGRSTGPHLHFEVRREGKPLNPEAFLKEGTARVGRV